MNMLREKFRSRRGFTLVEMLIVVAIIAILVAVSIPLIQSALEKARDAVDQANERAAMAEAVLEYMGLSDLTYEGPIEKQYFFYNAASGKLVLKDEKNTIAPYGKCTQKHPGEHLFMSEEVVAEGYPKEEDTGEHEGKVIMVLIDQYGVIRLFWQK